MLIDFSDNANIDIVKDVVHQLEDIDVPLETTWGITKALYFGNQSLMPQKYYESIHNRISMARNTKYTSKSIYNACKAALENNETKLKNGEKRIVEKLALAGKLNGLDLVGKTLNSYEYSMSKLVKKRDEVRQKIQVRFIFYIICYYN